MSTLRGLFDRLFPPCSATAEFQQLLDEIKTMSNTLETLTAEVAANHNVIDSAVELLTGLSVRLTTALEADDEAALQNLAADLSSQTAVLAAAVVANTPAESAQ